MCCGGGRKRKKKKTRKKEKKTKSVEKLQATRNSTRTCKIVDENAAQKHSIRYANSIRPLQQTYSSVFTRLPLHNTVFSSSRTKCAKMKMVNHGVATLPLFCNKKTSVNYSKFPSFFVLLLLLLLQFCLISFPPVSELIASVLRLGSF